MKNLHTVTIVGVGLIGGSIGLALRQRNLATRIIGTGSRAETLQTALETGAITESTTELRQAVIDSQLVLVCAPVDAIVPIVRKVAPHCAPGTLITDAGSTKAQIVGELETAATEPAWPQGVHFVGSHPLAGNEKKGPLHARADLFVDRAVVITPTADTQAADRTWLYEFWHALGARVVEMPADEHDRALAITSHLPHLMASAIAGLTPERYVTLTAGGWQDTTRIAAGDPLLWRQILLSNRQNVLVALDELTKSLRQWRSALAVSDAGQLERLLAEAKRIRDAVGS